MFRALKFDHATSPKPLVPIIIKMASYASIASKPVSSTPALSLDKEIDDVIQMMSCVTQAPDKLSHLVEIIRREMEIPGVSGFRGGGRFADTGANRKVVAPVANWRGNFGNSRFGNQAAFDTRTQIRTSHVSPNKAPSVKSAPVGRYHSYFKSSENIEDKILNTIIGNKLNSFTPLTYNDTRDFIYQIMDSGETEFTRDFIEKVFAKATVEELYCALFAKLIAEIAHRYPVMYEEMNKYHKEFLKIFDNVQEDSAVEYATLVKEKQYRMGYGHFIAELAGLNALEKSQLLTMVMTIIDKIWLFTGQENRTKAVEEFIDCLVRLITGLKDRSLNFFRGVKGEIVEILKERVEILISRSDSRPSLSNKARFGLMDLRDLIA